MTKTVAITGATGTLGRAVAVRFESAEQEWKVWGFGSQINVRWGNVVSAYFSEVAEEDGKIDALVTCAGISDVRPLLDTEDDEWRRVIDVNLTGTFLSIREAVRHGATRIVTIGSIHGCTPSSYPNRSAYTASKGGVKALTEALAVELAPRGVACNCVAPGHLPVLMDGTGAGQALLDAAQARTPTGRLATPEEVAEVIFWLCDAAPLSLTGQTVVVDGGFVSNTYPLGD